jgi:H+/Cl- antiporter ClcA
VCVLVMPALLQGGVMWGSHELISVAGSPAYAMVGAASVLASMFRAPLTGSLLLFELTR